MSVRFGEAGQALWDEIHAGLPEVPEGEEPWELDERETALLAMAAAQADVVADLDRLIAKEGLMTTGSKGQAVLHPAVAEARQGRQTIDRLLGHITLPLPERETGENVATQRARKAAEARYERDDRVRALRGAAA